MLRKKQKQKQKQKNKKKKKKPTCPFMSSLHVTTKMYDQSWK